jgi:XTP/dITP diphosphohydrolase
VTRILLATRNRGKAEEFARFFDRSDLVWTTLHDYPDLPPCVEDGRSYEENAEKKAVLYSGFVEGLVLGEDSGLEVEALGGFPGIRSARVGDGALTDAEKNALVLRKLAGVPDDKRKAEFVAVIVGAEQGKVLFRVRGECEGRITREPRGEDGFGYDPIFRDPASGRTFAEMSAEEKSGLSHRGMAMRELRRELESRYGAGS